MTRVAEISRWIVPVGFPKEKPAFAKEIRMWVIENRKNILEKNSPLAFVGFFELGLGGIIGLFFNSQIAATLGALIASSGIVTNVIDFLLGPNINIESFMAKVKNNETSPKVEKAETKIDNPPVATEVKSDNANADTTAKQEDLPRQDISTPSVDILKLIDCLNNKNKDQSPKARILAAIQLGKCQDKKVVTPLINCLKRKTDNAEVRSYCAFALGLRKDPKEIQRVIKVMIPILKNEKEKDTLREKIIIALGEIGDLEVLEFLQSLQIGNEFKEAINYAIERIEGRIS